MENKLNEIEKKALTFIRNQIMQGDRQPSLRNLMINLGYKSPRSASLIVAALIKKGLISRDDVTKEIRVNYFKNIKSRLANIPLVGAVTCGQPILAVENIEAYIPYEVKGDPKDYFFLRATGDSMDKAGIDDGDIILIKKQNTAKEGEIILALVDDYEATLKVFKKGEGCIMLQPRSSNKENKPIYIFKNLQIQGKFVEKIKVS